MHSTRQLITSYFGKTVTFQKLFYSHRLSRGEN